MQLATPYLSSVPISHCVCCAFGLGDLHEGMKGKIVDNPTGAELIPVSGGSSSDVMVFSIEVESPKNDTRPGLLVRGVPGECFKVSNLNFQNYNLLQFFFKFIVVNLFHSDVVGCCKDQNNYLI